MKFVQMLKNFHQEESGQDLVEYALVLVAIAAGVFAVNTNLQTMLSTAVTNLSAKIQTYLT